MYVDFIGVKIGDINGNATVNLTGTTSTETRSARSTTIESNVQDDAVMYSATADVNVAGLQFTINTGDKRISTITSDIFDDSSIGFNEVIQGVYNVSIANATALSVKEGDKLFAIEFDCLACDLSLVRIIQIHGIHILKWR